MKRKISKGNYSFIKNELDYFTENDLLKGQDKVNMLDEYEVYSKISFVRVILIIGSALIGLGILSFIASNWQAIGNLGKIGIILFFLGAAFYMSFRFSGKYEKTARATIYIGIFIYGAGIFLIGQIFNISGDYIAAFFFWSIGTLIISYIYIDKILYVASVFLTLAFILGKMTENVIVLMFLLAILTVFVERYLEPNKITTFSRNLVLLSIPLSIMALYHMKYAYGVIIYFVIGIAMVYINQKQFRQVYDVQGRIIMGISGIMLSFKNPWEDIVSSPTAGIISIAVGVGLFIYLLVQVKKQSIIALVFTCVLVLRYYFDTFYSFMPKFVFFIIGGLMLIGFGFYFEKMRREIGGAYSENFIRNIKRKNLISFIILSMLLFTVAMPNVITYLFGEDVIVGVKAVDPRDLFRGDYVALALDIDLIEEKLIEPELMRQIIEDKEYRYYDMIVYALLEKEGKEHSVKKVTLTKPKEGVYLESQIDYVNFKGNNKEVEEIILEFDVDKFFIEENTGQELEKVLRDGTALARLKVRSGKAVMVELIIE